eukprot:TRINITY_DN3181_c0_g1_i3.p1 TRINITY_DN3181_c0_g1~~TRINITY_DN3181_c0_g1_i3.p1  ORF type:complete len:325 (+),score=66.88 TRINITY_DN3181_c0_g1_i3:133-1107(+)
MCIRDRYYGWWWAKSLAAGSLCLMSFFLPNSFFVEYSYFAAVFSGIFVILQVMVLLDWAYAWNESWRGQEAPEVATGWRIALLVFSVLLLIGGLTLDGFMYYWFDCGLGYGMTTFSMVVMIALTLLSVTTWCEHGSLIASSVIFFNVQLITMTGLYNNDDANCNRLSSAGNETQVVFSLLLAALSITKAAWSSISNGDSAGGITRRSANTTTTEMRAKPDTEAPAPAEHVGFCSCWSGEAMPDQGAWRYLAILAVSMCYMGMLLSDWGVKVSNDCNPDDTRSDIGLWVNLATSWLIMLLYLWSLIAPQILTDREFGPGKSQFQM